MKGQKRMKPKFSSFLVCIQVILILVVGSMGSTVFGQEVIWLSEIQISDDSSRSEYAHIVIDSQDNNHIFWVDGRDGTPPGGSYWYGNIYYSKLDKYGNIQVDQKPVMTANSCYVRLVATVDSDDNLHLSWTDGRLHAPGGHQYSNWEVYYKKLDNNGNTLIDDVRLTNAPYYSGSSDITMDKYDNVYISWSDLRNINEWPGYWPTEGYFSKLDKNGNILIDNKRLTYDFNNTGTPHLVVDSDGNIHMIHYKYDYISGPNNRRVFYTKLDNDGNILIPNTQIGPIQSAGPEVAIDSNDNLHISWAGTTDGVEGDVWTTYYKKLDKFGATLIDHKELCPGNTVSIALGPGDTVHISSIAFGNSLYYYKLDSNGEILYNNNGDPITTAPSSNTNVHPKLIDVDSSRKVYIVWSKMVDSNSEVFCLIQAFNQPPVAVCKDVLMSADENCRVFITPGDVDGGSYDPDEGDEIELSIDNAGPFSTGIHYVTLTVTDEEGESSSCQAMVNVYDTTPPVIETLSANPDILWPPNHKMVPVTLTVSASDNCEGVVNSQITTVSSNEPIDGLGDGDTSPDWEITGDLSVNLRAERSGTGTGRIYTITVMCTDAAGNSSEGTVTVIVPHNK